MRSTITERVYRVWRDEDETSARLAYQQCLALPVEWMRDRDALLLMPAEIKALILCRWPLHGLLLAPAGSGAILMHKDAEFHALPIEQEALPLKAKRGGRLE